MPRGPKDACGKKGNFGVRGPVTQEQLPEASLCLRLDFRDMRLRISPLAKLLRKKMRRCVQRAGQSVISTHTAAANTKSRARACACTCVIIAMEVQEDQEEGSRKPTLANPRAVF